jgi:mono/diheme cytochrome c family protein
MKVHACSLLAAATLIGCAEADDRPQPEPVTPLERGAAYVDDIDYRRDALVASIVNPDNSYSTRRLSQYGVVSEWESLPVWNPPAAPIRLDGRGTLATDEEPTAVFEPVEWTDEALRELGRRAFENYPVQLSGGLEAAASTEEERDRYGFWVDGRGRVGGLVTVALPSGRTDTAVTCATCHATPDEDGDLAHGRVNPSIDIGLYNAHQSPPGESQDRLLGWGPGRVDVTPDQLDNPTAIGDLRAVRFQSHLHSAATLHNDLIALAIRIETLIITSLGEVVRPPRELTFAMAWYLWTLEAPSVRPLGTEPEGEAIFQSTCSSCHRTDGTTADPVPLAAVGTDPAVAESPARGTGAWRVPSLWGVSTRTQLLHTASVSSISELLDPIRLESTPGHAFGTTLDSNERAALVRFVETLGD